MAWKSIRGRQVHITDDSGESHVVTAIAWDPETHAIRAASPLGADEAGPQPEWIELAAEDYVPVDAEAFHHETEV